MAAHQNPQLPEVVEIRQLAPGELERLLGEEERLWRSRYQWDFHPSSELVQRFVQMQALSGYALRVDRELIGYAYYVFEDHKGLIGDFYVRSGPHSALYESLLLSSVVESLINTPGIRRIESQLLLNRGGIQGGNLPFDRYAARFDREFMNIDAAAVFDLERRDLDAGLRLVPWNDRFHEETAHLIAASYRGHIDSQINDQYRTIPGARRFLTNIIKYPGCGQFSPQSSIVAVDDATGRVRGVCLTSLVSEVSGHVTQLCILPAMRGFGLGYELLRRSLTEVVREGRSMASLTVTGGNMAAIRLYESMGFRHHATFPALVWEGF
jgi:ribosomal protein S18 acetylase RimI-like enzyme